MTLELTATHRAELGKGVQALRAEGMMPAVVYGPKQEATAISISLKEFQKVFDEAGESTVVTVRVGTEAIPTLIHEVDHDPVTHVPRHADFYAIVKGQKVQVTIPLVFTGESPAEKAGANIIKTLYEVEVEADPMNLPHELSVDLTVLDAIGAQIALKDIVLPVGVSFTGDADEVVALAAAAQEEDLAAAPTEVDMSQIGDAVEKGKKEEEEAEVA